MVSEGVVVYITEPVNGPLEIEVPHNPRFVTQLKQDIPSKLRSWKPKVECTDDKHHVCSGRWLVDKSQKEEVISLVKAFYANVVYEYPGGRSNFRRTIA